MTNPLTIERTAPAPLSGPGLEPLTGVQLARSTMAIVLAGGRGTRLGRLTDWRSKPAVPFGGKFRFIDFPLSNCVNSGIRRIGVCTQYKAQSLIRHVQHGWSFLNARFEEFVELLPAQQNVSADWYKGTADAIYQNIYLLRKHAPSLVLVLAGDHIYKMDYNRMLYDHVTKSADMTIACMEVPLAEARGFGVMAVDDSLRVVAFQEKPEHPAPMPGHPDTALVSMGIYVFNAAFLYEQLERDSADPRSTHDFGKDVIPHILERGYRLVAHRFSDSCVNMTQGRPYWRDVGTLDAYWEANMELAKVTPDLNMYDTTWPIWTYQEQLPPAKFVFDDDGRRGMAVDSLVSGGCVISGATLRRSLLFSNVHVHSYAHVEDSVVLPNVDIGRNVVLKRAVVEKNCRLPPGLQIGVNPEEDCKRFDVSSKGITLVVPEMLAALQGESAT
ncbi:MAG TPA: glucose-1-phosphate adenylyltransferase [Burkholderiaceae bacterium]|nr:glucose-1-phosphate adenylyltransferase [Burkholderiaceae bacterium]